MGGLCRPKMMGQLFTPLRFLHVILSVSSYSLYEKIFIRKKTVEKWFQEG
jgi:hypothetical protein